MVFFLHKSERSKNNKLFPFEDTVLYTDSIYLYRVEHSHLDEFGMDGIYRLHFVNSLHILNRLVNPNLDLSLHSASPDRILFALSSL